MSYVPDAADRIQKVKNVATGLDYASMTFVGPDNVKTMLLGNGITETVSWNERAQPTVMQATSGIFIYRRKGSWELIPMRLPKPLNLQLKS